MNIFKRKKKKSEINRSSNFELMRIISMYMIVLFHMLMRIQAYSVDGNTKAVVTILQSLTFVHVNSFVLLFGYFNYNKKVSFSKFLKLYNEVWFYKALIPIVLVLLGMASIDIVSMIKSVSFLYYGDYWYITVYLVFLLVSPIFNIVINNTDKKTHLKIIIILLIVFSIFPTITEQESFAYATGRGTSFFNFMILYFIGSYLAKYPIEKSYIFSKITLNSRRLLYAGGYIFSSMIVGLFYFFGHYLSSFGEISNAIGSIFTTAYGAFDNPIVIFASVCYFLFFSTFKFKSKFINKIGACTLAVYLIHFNEYFFEDFLNIFHLNTHKVLNYSDVSIAFKCMGYAFVVLIICVIIEYIRQLIFKFIYNRKISFKLRNRARLFVDSFGFSINW